MKKIIVFLIFFSLLSYETTANDGVFYARGNILFPLEETNIELKKEILILNIGSNNSSLDVSIYFEFYNPDDEVEKLVGFVTPPAGGAVNELERAHPHISNFSVNVNNTLIGFNIAKVDSTEFNSVLGKFHGQDFIYYFKIKFKKGLNIIRHSYSYKGSYMADPKAPGPNFQYRLTTGKMWANKKIDDFEILINIGPDSYFSVPTYFEEGKNVDWKIIGIGKIGDANAKNLNQRRVKIKSGFLYYKTTDFKPDFDLTISTVIPFTELKDYCDIYFRGNYNKPRELSDLSVSDLRLIRNSYYAIHGFKFKSAELNAYFNKFTWYIPDPNLRNDNVIFSPHEKSIIEKIVEEEKWR